MVIYSNIVTSVALTLGSVDTLNPPALEFKAIRKNTRTEVSIDPIIISSNDERWIRLDLDGSLFEIGEHTYQVLDNTDIVENGLLIVQDGTKTEIPEYHPELENEKGEHIS